MGDDLISLAVFSLDCPAPPSGWAAELDRRGVAVVVDDVGRPSIPRAVARGLLTERREEEAWKARRREEIERRAIEADQAFRAALPRGLRPEEVPPGVTPAELLMLSDPMPGARRQSVLEHALEHPAGAIVYTPLGEEAHR